MGPALDREFDSGLRGPEGAGSSTITDLPSVKVTGALSFSKVRVLWADGLLRLFDTTGRVAELTSTAPCEQHSGWFKKRWKVETTQGVLRLTSACHCGFRSVTRKPAVELWADGR